MLITILAIIAILLLAAIVLVAVQPDKFSVQRSAILPAPASAVFPHVNDLHLWEAWSPWAKKDPNAKNTYSGAPAGEGASVAWAGNKEVGEGRMTITTSRPNEAVRIKLEFFKPFKATNAAEFAFKPEGNGTLVVWTMAGTSNFMGKLFGLMINCDAMIGRDFEKGLANLREVTTKK